MLKLVLNSVNVDLGWGNDKCYSKIKDANMVDLLKDSMFGYDNDGYNGILEYYVCDVEYGVDDIPQLDKVMLEFKEALKDSLMLFDSYSNYEESKLKGIGTFKVVLSDLSDYDTACYSLLKLVSKIYVKSDATLNIVAFDYVDRVLKTLPLCSVFNDNSNSFLAVSYGTPLLFHYLDKEAYKVNSYCILEQYRELFDSAIADGKVVLV